jgi:hypothetical protein
MEEDGVAQEVRNAFTKRSHYWHRISGNKFKQLGWMKKADLHSRRTGASIII